MAFYSLQCDSCGHGFFRVEVRCEEYGQHACPACGSRDTHKKFVPPDPGETTAEDQPCCGGDHGASKGSCDSCTGCGHH